jgi:hypothetical protein
VAHRAVQCEGFELVRGLYTRSAHGQKTEESEENIRRERESGKK